MKCHWCHQELQMDFPEYDLVKSYCRDGHVHIVTDNLSKEIISYTITWDQDSRARERFRLRYNSNLTTLSVQDKTNKQYYSASYVVILSVDTKINLITENDIIQGERMINSLRKLKAFA